MWRNRRAVLSWLLLAAAASAQQPPDFRVEADLVLVPFHVSRNNAYVLNLKPEDIRLLEDGAPRPFSVFEFGGANKRKLPVDIVLLFDYSCAMLQTGMFDPTVFKNGLLDGMDNVRVSVYGFGGELRRYCRPTRDMAVYGPALRALVQRQPVNEIQLELPPKRKGGPDTWIYEAVIAAARDAMPRPYVSSDIEYRPVAQPRDETISQGNVLMMVFSDGIPTTNSVPEDASAVCQRLGVPVYPVVLCHNLLLDRIKQVQETGRDRQGNLTSAANARMMDLRAAEKHVEDFGRLGELTGGRSFDSPQLSLEAMRQILSFMVGQVRNQYVAGFVPEKTGAPERQHKLEVRLLDKGTGKVVGGSRTVVH
jgi:VWFA-related protein